PTPPQLCTKGGLSFAEYAGPLVFTIQPQFCTCSGDRRRDDIKAGPEAQGHLEGSIRAFTWPFQRPSAPTYRNKRSQSEFWARLPFVVGCNESLAKYLPPGLANSWGVSMAKWSREGDDIISNLRLRSLRKQETTIPIRITVGTEQVKI